LAVQDITQALLLENKYAAPYCVHRGLLLFAQHDFAAAAADFTVALLLDPQNRTARAHRQKALEQKESQFELNIPVLDLDEAGPTRGPDAECAPEAAPGGATQAGRAAAETQTQIELPGDEAPAEEEGEAAAGEEAPAESDGTPAAAAQRSWAPDATQQRSLERAAELRRDYAEAQRKEEAEKKAKSKRESQRRKKGAADEDATGEWVQRAARGVLVACAIGLILLFGVGLYAFYAPSFYPAPVGPSITAEELLAEFQKDNRAANIKYGERPNTITGTVGKV